MITVFFLVVLLPNVLPSKGVFAQSTGYTITSVDHEIEVMYTGEVVIRDTMHISGQVPSEFTIGLPSNYSAFVLKGVAYDPTDVYQLNLGVQLGNRSGFYGAEVDFGGKTPSVFTVAFVLSSGLLQYDAASGFYALSYPAYPSFTQEASNCDVAVNLPSTPPSITITKSDGVVSQNSYSIQNLPAYTYEIATATFQLSTGTLQFTDITQLNRQITISPTGQVTASDKYYLTNNATAYETTTSASTSVAMSFFVVGVPPTATNVVITDAFGRTLTTTEAGTVSYGNNTSPDILLENATLVTFITSGESTIITASYKLPSATINGDTYSLSNFTLTPDFYYYVDQATITFSPPEGATITSPQLSSLDSSSSLTRNSFQDTYTVTRNGISYIDYSAPEGNTVQLAFNYNPIWVSFRPTFWASLLAVIGCVAAVFYRRSRPEEKGPKPSKKGKATSTSAATTTTAAQQVKTAEITPGQRITAENIKEFTDSYEERKELNSELKSLDARAQKGKMPRRQYKVQRKAVEMRLETLTRNTDRLRNLFRNSSSAYADLMKQLDSAETELTAADQGIKNLEISQSKGAVSMETYKKNMADYQKRKEKAESSISGILLRLREKTR